MVKFDGTIACDYLEEIALLHKEFAIVEGKKLWFSIISEFNAVADCHFQSKVSMMRT
ncbi:hypothetical protein [Phormidesmis priestleyi]